MSAYSAANHDALITDVRSGSIEPAQAAEQLKSWLDSPGISETDRTRVVSDLIVMAVRAGDTPRAVAVARSVPLDALPDWAMPSLVGAARREGDTTLQGDAITAWLARTPNAWPARVARVRWQIDRQALDTAQVELDALATPANMADTAQAVDVWEARGALAEAQDRPLRALAAYQAVLNLAPDHRYARRAVSFQLGRTNAPDTALRAAEAAEAQQPGLFSDFELATIRQQALGRDVLWAIGERDQNVANGARRFEALDRALARFEEQIAAADAAGIAAPADGGVTSEDWQRLANQLRFDQIVGWFARGRFDQVLAADRALTARGVTRPYYVLSAVAGSWQQHRRSDLAVPLYEQAIADAGEALPIPSDTHVGLVYAYLDTAEFDKADALLSHIEAETPPLLRLTPEQGRANPEYSEVRHLRALHDLYTDRVDQAERGFASLSSLAPMNAGFREGEAQTARVRQHPEAALAAYQALRTDHPDDPTVRAGHAAALYDNGRYREAREMIQQLSIDAPESLVTRNAQRMREAIEAPRLDVEAGAAREGGALANREWNLDARLTSGLMDDQWRIYARQVWTRADLDSGEQRLARSGLGLQWEQGRWALDGALNHASSGRYRTGVSAEAAYRASDNWRLSATLDTNSLQTPWRARDAGIGAHETGASVIYMVNESRRFTATWQGLDLSDGNRRDALSLAWRERWISQPRLRLESTLSAETGRSDTDDVPYFSPRRDHGVGASVLGRLLTWKRDDRRFFQEVEAGIGAYSQNGFGTAGRQSLLYAHAWEIGDALQLRYGLGMRRQPYDGRHETSRDVFLSISVPLQ